MLRRIFHALLAAMGFPRVKPIYHASVDPMAEHRAKRAAYMRDWRIKDKAKKAAQAASVTRESRVILRDVTRDSRVNNAQESQEKRAHLAIVPPTTTPSLSNNLNMKKREKGKGGLGERGPLPPDWEPDAELRTLAVERLGEIGTANLIAKFREHYSDDPRLLTPGQWRRLFRDTWVKREHPPAQLSLRVMAAVPKQTAIPGKVYLKIESPQGEAWKRYAGKSFPQNSDGGWWFESEWPPGHDVRQAS